jgi:hypothetical protein
MLKMKKLALLAFVGCFIASAALAQPVTTKPNISNTVAQCLLNVPVVGNGAAASPICGAGALGTAAFNSIGTSGAFVPLLNTANTWSAIQLHNPNDLALAGATSGALTLNAPAIAAASVITFPAGTTNFSATGGASQVVKQTSSGGAFTVAQLATSDISGFPAAGQLPGTATNDNATAGNVGEYRETIVPVGSAISVSNGVTANLAQLTSLPAGDWAVSCTVITLNGGTTVLTTLEVAINGTSATLPARGVIGTNGVGAGSNGFQNFNASAGSNQALATMPTRVSLASATTIFCPVNVAFSVSTSTIYGVLHAWRTR